jgi:bacteriocin biosynthesis cyclodehydratase domain-containing protein
MVDSTKIRPRLKQDSIFLPIPGGLICRNGDKVLTLKGKSIYKWLSTLVPHLSGEHTLEEICAPLGPDQQTMVTNIVLALLEKEIIKNHSLEETQTLQEIERVRFKSQLDFIDHYADRPVAAFQKFRQSRVLLVGDGSSLTALALSLFSNGLERLALANCSDESRSEIESEIAALRQFGVKASLSIVDQSNTNFSGKLKEFQLVAYCSDRPSLRAALLLNEQCVSAGVAFISGLVFDGRSLIGPFVDPSAKGCLLCCFMRLSSNIEERQRATLWRSLTLGDELVEEGMTAGGPTAKMLGNSVAFEAFKILGGFLPAESSGHVLVQNLHTLETSRATILPHPLCPTCSKVDAVTQTSELLEVVRGERDQELTDEASLQKWGKHINVDFGLFKNFEDEQLLQLPLRTTLLVAGHPLDAASDDVRVPGHSEDSSTGARVKAVLEATRRYADALPDRRRTINGSLKELVSADSNPISPQHLSVWSGGPSLKEDSRIEWLPACSLHTQSIYHVPAASVYPFSPFNRLGHCERATAGSAVGLTFREVMTNGIVSALCYEGLRELARGQGTLILLDQERLGALDSEVAYLVKSAQRLETSVRLLEIVSPSPVRSVLATTVEGDSLIGHLSRIGSGFSRAEAARQALVNLLGAIQSPQLHEHVAACDELQFPELSLSLDFNPPALAEELYQETPATIEEVESFLRSHGREVLFVNTTTGDLRENGFPITGKVLLTEQRNWH